MTLFEPQSLSQGFGILIGGLILHFIFIKVNNKQLKEEKEQ